MKKEKAAVVLPDDWRERITRVLGFDANCGWREEKIKEVVEFFNDSTQEFQLEWRKPYLAIAGWENAGVVVGSQAGVLYLSSLADGRIDSHGVAGQEEELLANWIARLVPQLRMARKG